MAKSEVFHLPEAQVLIQHLFERDVYKDENGNEGKPEYRVLMAFDPDEVTGEDTIEDHIIDTAVAEWGSDAEDAYIDRDKLNEAKGIASPFGDGDERAAELKERGKEGPIIEAYEGKLYASAHSQFNKHGDNGPGGAFVVGEDAEEITAADPSAIYNGCWGVAAVTLKAYKSGKKRGVTMYLVGFQKTRDGDRLMSTDNSGLFSAREGAKKDMGEKSRRRRSR